MLTDEEVEDERDFDWNDVDESGDTESEEV
jgi:hypothetical protein